jgi:hypothetical protein
MMTTEPSIFMPASSLYKMNGRRFFATYPSHTIVPMPSLSPVSFILATSFYIMIYPYPEIISLAFSKYPTRN